MPAISVNASAKSTEHSPQSVSLIRTPKIAQVAFTSTEERNTFLHGMKWFDGST
jgi:hypothetical protein